MGTECAFVGDGYDMEGTIKRSPGVHPQVDITYRAATRAERTRHLKDSRDPDRETDVMADLIVRHVSAWSLGEKPAKEKVLKLQPSLFDRIVEFILGYAGSPAEDADRKNF